jgi:hypothetical protein
VPSSTFCLTQEGLHELTELAVDLFAEAERCAEVGFWRPAVLSLGGAVEAGIVATAACFEPELRQQGVWPAGDDPLDWTLGQATRVAKDAGWFPVALSGPKGDIFAPLVGEVGDAVSFLVRLRNMLVHPGAYVREQDRPDFSDPEHMRPTYGILQGIAGSVFEQLQRVLIGSQPGNEDDPGGRG